MSQVHQAIARELAGVAETMQPLELWDSEPPSAEALASQEPFCIDTLSFPQWLQFIFLPRMNALCAQNLPLPNKCGITPLCEEYFRPLDINSRPLIETLARIDNILD